ncbi:MAG: hypothetical protein ACE5E5_12880 [Phycisphaerae bacterium]
MASDLTMADGLADGAHPEPSAYEALVRRILPRLLPRFESMPCLGGDLEHWIGAATDLDGPNAALSAALAMICTDAPRSRSDSAFVPVRVHAALTTWQLRLRVDGRPRSSRLLYDPSLLFGAHLVVTILTEASRYQNASLLGDLRAHLSWLATRRFVNARHEIQCAAILVHGALLFRDRAMLDTGRTRLVRSLEDMNRLPGMGDGRDPDVGELCHIVDAIAPLYRVHGWPELHRPLELALGVLGRLVHPDGRIPHATRFPAGLCCSPWGPELLAERFPAAAALARLCREHCRELLAGGVARWSDRQSAKWAPTLALAALHAPVDQPRRRPLPADSQGCGTIEEAGVVTFGNESFHAEIHIRCGGTLHVTWRDSRAALTDKGLLLVHGSKVRAPVGCGGRTRCSVASATVDVFGTLRRSTHHGRRYRALLIGGQRMLRKLGAAALGRVVFGSEVMMRLRRRLSPDRYWREIRLGDDWVSIRDVIRSRQRFDAVIVRAAGRTGASAVPDVSVDQACPISLGAPCGCRVVITRVYKHGALVECSSSVDPPRRIFKPKRAHPEQTTAV